MSESKPKKENLEEKKITQEPKKEMDKNLEENKNKEEAEKNNIIEQEKTKEKVKTKENNMAKRNIKTPIIIFSALIIILLILSVIFALVNINNDKILSNISIMGIDVSNMTQEEAKEAVNEVVNLKLEEEMTLKKDEYETNLNAIQLDASFDVEKAVNEAYGIGRNGNIVVNNYNILYTMLFGQNLECEFTYEEESLDEKIDDISSKLPGAVVESSYYIEEEDLIIVKGTEGIAIKKDELKETIINAIKNIETKYTIITIPTENAEPESIDLEKIRNEIYKEPQDASVSKNSETGKTEVHTHVNGVDFAISMGEAEEIIAKDKEEYTIPLKITVPDKTLADLGEEAFPDELATYTTRYDPSNRNRSNNLAISAEKIDGTIIMPGETFSYNQTVGERTIAEGYKEAGAYAGGRVVQDVGG